MRSVARGSRLGFIIALCLAAVLTGTPVHSALAAPIICSQAALDGAIIASNGSGDPIELPTGCSLSLSTGTYDGPGPTALTPITGNVIIFTRIGSPAATITRSSGTFRIFAVRGGTLTLINVVVDNGLAQGGAGGSGYASGGGGGGMGGAGGSGSSNTPGGGGGGGSMGAGGSVVNSYSGGDGGTGVENGGSNGASSTFGSGGTGNNGGGGGVGGSIAPYGGAGGVGGGGGGAGYGFDASNPTTGVNGGNGGAGGFGGGGGGGGSFAISGGANGVGGQEGFGGGHGGDGNGSFGNGNGGSGGGGGGFGGGVFIRSGTLKAYQVTFSNNKAQGGAGGGGDQGSGTGIIGGNGGDGRGGAIFNAGTFCDSGSTTSYSGNTTAGGAGGKPTGGGGLNGDGGAAGSTNEENYPGGSGLNAGTMTISCGLPPTISVTPLTLPSGTVGSSYSQSVSGSGGTGTLTFSSGDLPSWLSLSPAGALTGIPTGSGPYTFHVTATDAIGFTSSAQSYTISATGIAPTITGNPSDASVCVPNKATFTAGASGSPSPTVNWQVSINGGGSFSPIGGATSTSYTTPATVLSDSGKKFRAVFTNGVAPDATTSAATLTVSAGATITTNPANQTVILSQMATFTAAANNNNGVQWKVSTNGGASYSNIGGATNPTYSFTPTAADNGHKFEAVFSSASCGTVTTSAATLTVKQITITLSPSKLNTMKVGAAFNQSVVASGGTAPYTYTLTGTLPPGINLNPATGQISGTPTAVGAFSFGISATDTTSPGGPYTSPTVTYSEKIDPPTVLLTTGSPLTPGKVGAAYAQAITASGGTAPYTYSLTGSLPAGLTLDAGGNISGTPTAAGTFTFSVTAADSTTGPGTSVSASKVYKLVVSN